MYVCDTVNFILLCELVAKTNAVQSSTVVRIHVQIFSQTCKSLCRGLPELKASSTTHDSLCGTATLKTGRVQEYAQEFTGLIRCSANVDGGTGFEGHAQAKIMRLGTSRCGGR